METSLELFVKNTKYPVSQNVTEVIEQANKVRNSLVDTFKKFCVDDSISDDEMDILNHKTEPSYYWPDANKNDYDQGTYGEYINIPHEFRVRLWTKTFKISNKICLVLTEDIQDYGYKKETKTFETSTENLSFLKKIQKLFGKKFTYPVTEITFNITKGAECYLESFDIKQNISLEDYNLLSSFFQEQKERKNLEEKVKLYNELIKDLDTDTKFVSEELN